MKPQKLQWDDENVNRVLEALHRIPAGHRVDDVGKALHSLHWIDDHFDWGLEYWDRWAKYDKAYQGFKDLQARWQSFDGGMINTLFDIAKEHGWKDVTEKFFTQPYIFRDETKIPRRDFLYGHHLLRKTVSVTAAAGATGKSSKGIVDAMAMASGKRSSGCATSEAAARTAHQS